MTGAALAVGDILERLGKVGKRPKFAFMVLTLISEAAGQKGTAGPYVETKEGSVPLRDWIAIQLAKLGEDSKSRREMRNRIRAQLKNELPTDPLEAQKIIDDHVRQRVYDNIKRNVSHAVGELEKAELLSRHYAGYAKSHVNRGAQRHAVYTLTGDTIAALRRGTLLL